MTTALPQITTLAWVPPFARGFVRDLRPRWAFEEVGQAYEVNLISSPKTDVHLKAQPFGQVPTYRDEEVELFESGAIVLRIAERARKLIPQDPVGRSKAIQWTIAALNTIEPVIMNLTINNVFEVDQPWSRERRALVRDYVDRRLSGLEAHLRNRAWLEGDQFTVGDLVMVSVLGGLRGTGIVEGFPLTMAYVTRGEERPAYQRAMTDHLAVFDQQDSTV